MNKITALSFWIIVTLFSLLPLSELFSQGTRLLREPTVSQDHIVFVYANDLWITDRNGGDARRLTSGEGGETDPHFSPDGSKIAFTAQYDGNTDVYVVSTKGGQPERLTWHGDNDEVTGWTPDGEKVLFVSERKGVPTKSETFYTISLNGGLPQKHKIPRAATGEISSDGKYIAYQPVDFWDPEWRNYRGGQAKPIWVVDLQNNELQRTPRANKERHINPVWLNGKVFFLSERDYTMNVWFYNPQTGESKQQTFHSQFDVKNLDAGDNIIVYEQGGYLYELDPATGSHKQIEIHVRGDMTWARPRWVDASATSLSNASLSATGERALFQFRGEIITVPKEKGSWRNLTKSSGVANRYPIWSPDGQKIAWFSDESGEYRLYISDQKGLEEPKEIELPEPTFFFEPAWSPDGNYISYTDTHYRLWYVNTNTGEATHVDTDGYANPTRTLNPKWSPDSKWIAYSKRLPSQYRVIKVHNIESGETHQITDRMADSIDPVWDKSGKYIYFFASTDFALNTGWLDMSSYDMSTTRGLYMVLLDDETPSPFLPESSEEPKADDKKEDENNDTSETTEVTIETENITDRVVTIDIPEKGYTDLIAGPENHVFYKEGGTLYRYNITEEKQEEFLTPAQQVEVSHDRQNLLYRSGETWGIVSTTGAPQEPGNGKIDTDHIRVRVNPPAEWAQIFREGWRFQRDFLYVDNEHGAPWDKIYDWYEPWVDHIRHRSDMSYLIDILGGEVSVGHSYTYGGDYPDLDEVSIGLLGADLEEANGHYRIKRIYTDENWNPNLEAPLAQPGLEVEEGDYILAVNGEELDAPTNPFSLFEGTAGRNTILTINDSPSMEGAENVSVVPIEEERGLRLRSWIEGNRRKVEKMSNGRLAYVWLPNTGQGGYQAFNRYYFAQQDKDGVVIDERNNGGGSAADYMIDVMDRELLGYFNSKAGDKSPPFTTPMAGLWGPKVMIINERAGSGGDLLPYMFREKELGPLVGTRTWGGLVGTWDTPSFIDGGGMIAPRGGFYNTEGEWDVEGEGIAPDFPVMQLPKEVINGKDPQLIRAVKEAQKLLKTEDIELKKEPAPPVKWKRAEETEGWN
ncbi:S41 family peptidase [Fodinibius halophilus]|uniref:Tricorn protease homolog n=1 Tax=Fodinibius halophilus TaxID=1736908 RepID=A0A6M1T4B6_9BACT|nr:S41 family peptidase [Fodinibius halophilus]NGP88929.1 protease [Fodinibius halophilus]